MTKPGMKPGGMHVRPFLAGLAVAFMLCAPPRAGAQSPDAGIDFGNDSGGYVDGECDDPRFQGPGVYEGVGVEGLEFSDATDCRAAVTGGQASLRPGAIASLSELRARADGGDAQAQYDLGVVYLNGEGAQQSDAEAARWFREAAEAGHSDAQVELGWMYDDGGSLPLDEMEAARWYRLAADQGNVRGQHNLGYLYQYGEGALQDYAEAMRWYRAAADQDFARSQTNVGYLYENGLGVPQSDADAAQWYLLAAEGGDPIGQKNIGGFYATGRGVAQNQDEAIRWYRAAAAQGEQDAADYLASLEAPAAQAAPGGGGSCNSFADFNAQFAQMTAVEPLRDTWGARDTFQWSHYMGARGLDLLEACRAGMTAADYQANYQALVGMRDQGYTGCEQLSSAPGTCVAAYPGGGAVYVPAYNANAAYQAQQDAAYQQQLQAQQQAAYQAQLQAQQQAAYEQQLAAEEARRQAEEEAAINQLIGVIGQALGGSGGGGAYGGSYGGGCTANNDGDPYTVCTGR